MRQFFALGFSCTIHHGEINRVLLNVFNSFIITFLIIVHSCSISMVYSSNNTIFTSSNITMFTSSNNTMFTSSNNTMFTSSHIYPNSWLELPSLNSSLLNSIGWMELPSMDSSLLRHTHYTSSVQDLHLSPRLLLQRQSYMHTVKVNILMLSINCE